MLTKSHGRIIPAIAVMLLFGAAGLHAQQEPAAEDCRIDVNEVAINVEPVVVHAAYSEEIGETLRALLEEESGVEVVAIEEGAEPLSLFLTLDTRHAGEGEWFIALEGEAGECRGTLVVAPDDPVDPFNPDDFEDPEDAEDPKEEDPKEEDPADPADP